MINASGVATTTATNNAKKNVEKVEKEVKTKPSKSPYLKLVTSESYADVVKGKNASLLSSEDVYFFVPTPNASYTNPDATILLSTASASTDSSTTPATENEKSEKHIAINAEQTASAFVAVDSHFLSPVVLPTTNESENSFLKNDPSVLLFSTTSSTSAQLFVDNNNTPNTKKCDKSFMSEFNALQDGIMVPPSQQQEIVTRVEASSTIFVKEEHSSIIPSQQLLINTKQVEGQQNKTEQEVFKSAEQVTLFSQPSAGTKYRKLLIYFVYLVYNPTLLLAAQAVDARKVVNVH